MPKELRIANSNPLRTAKASLENPSKGPDLIHIMDVDDRDKVVAKFITY